MIFLKFTHSVRPVLVVFIPTLWCQFVTPLSALDKIKLFLSVIFILFDIGSCTEIETLIDQACKIAMKY